MKFREVLIAGVFLLLSAIALVVIGLWPEPAPVEETPVIFSTDTPEIVLQYFDRILNQGDLEVIEDIFAPDHKLYVSKYPLVGTEILAQMVESQRNGLPDIVFHVDQVIVEEERFAVRYTFQGTHEERHLAVNPTGRGVTATGILISRMEGGKIVETWDMLDQLGILIQMGALTSPVGQVAYDWGSEPLSPASPPGDPEQNKRLVLECIEQIWNQGNLELAEALHAPDFRPHETTYSFVHDVSTLRELVGVMRENIPDLEVTVEEMVAQDYDVAVRWTARGRRMEWWGITIYRIVDGKISETWWSRDSRYLFERIGLIPIIG